MGKISSVHGMCLSAWAIAGLTGNQMASAIVKSLDRFEKEIVLSNGDIAVVNPVGYQTVLYVTGTLYVIALIISCVMVPKLNNKETK
jgi:OFA family oxalate/formate antiporter-like MFS transporter